MRDPFLQICHWLTPAARDLLEDAADNPIFRRQTRGWTRRGRLGDTTRGTLAALATFAALSGGTWLSRESLPEASFVWILGAVVTVAYLTVWLINIRRPMLGTLQGFAARLDRDWRDGSLKQLALTRYPPDRLAFGYLAPILLFEFRLVGSSVVAGLAVIGGVALIAPNSLIQFFGSDTRPDAIQVIEILVVTFLFTLQWLAMRGVMFMLGARRQLAMAGRPPRGRVATWLGALALMAFYAFFLFTPVLAWQTAAVALGAFSLESGGLGLVAGFVGAFALLLIWQTQRINDGVIRLGRIWLRDEWPLILQRLAEREAPEKK